MTRSMRWNEMKEAEDKLDQAVIALEGVIRMGAAPPIRGSSFIEQERLLREVAFRKSEYEVAVDQYESDSPPRQADDPPRKNEALLARSTRFDDGYLKEIPIDNGRELPKIAEPGKALKKEDIKDEHGNLRSPRDAEAARLLTQDAFKKLHLHQIDESIKRGALDEDFESGFIQSVRNFGIISKRPLSAGDTHEVKAINRAIWTEFLTLYQQRTDDLLTQELNFRFFGRARPDGVTGQLPLAFMDPSAQLTLAGLDGGRGQAMLTALGLPNAPPNLPTFAQFKAAMITLQPNTPQWDNFWNAVPADPIDPRHPDRITYLNRSTLQGLVKSHQMVSNDNTVLLADAKVCKNVIETKSTEYKNSISAYEHILDHNDAMKGVTPEATIAIAPSVTALALAEEAAKRGPINPDALGAAAHAAILAGMKHGTADNIKNARANEVSESVKDAARVVEAKYNTDAALIASPAAAAAAVSNMVFAHGNILKNIPVNPPTPPSILAVLNSIANSARSAVLNLEAPGAVPPPAIQQLGDIVHGTVMDAVGNAARALRGRLNDPNPNTAKAALSLIAGAGAIAAAVSAAARKNNLNPVPSRNLGLQAAARFITNNGVIEEADIRALGVAIVLNNNVIKALSQAARTASLTTEGAAAANDVRMNSQQRVEQEATRLNIPRGLAKIIGDKLTLRHFSNGGIDDANATACINEGLTYFNNARDAIYHSAGNFNLIPGVGPSSFRLVQGGPTFILPPGLREKIRDKLITHITTVGTPVKSNEVLDIINRSQGEYNQEQAALNLAPPAPPPIALSDNFKEGLSNRLIEIILDPPPPPVVAMLPVNFQIALPGGFTQALLRPIHAIYENTARDAIAAGIGRIGQGQQGLENDIKAGLTAGRSTLELTISTAEKLSTDSDSVQQVAAAAFITQSDRRPAQPPAGDVIGAAYKIGRPSEMMTAATTLAAAAKNTALELGLSAAEASAIAREIVASYVTQGNPVNEQTLNNAINAAVPNIAPANRGEIRQNVLVAYASICGQKAGSAAVKAHPQADQVKVKAVASVSAALGIYYGLTAPLAAQLGAGLAALYVQAAQAGQPLTDEAIRNFITTHLLISVGFPNNPVNDSTLNAISKASRAASTIASENVTEATKAAAQAFPTNDDPRNSYNASIVATLCAGKKPVDIANSVAVAKAGVLASKASAEKVGSPAAAAASAAAALLEGNPPRVNDLLNPATRLVTAQAIANVAAQAISDVDDPLGANPQLVQDTKEAVRTSVRIVAFTAAGQQGATLSSISQAVSVAAAIAAAAVKAGCTQAQAEDIATEACRPEIMAKGIGAVLNKIRNEITSRNIVLPLPHQENVNSILKAASSGFGIGAGVVAGDVSRLAANLAIGRAAAIQVHLGVGGVAGLAGMAGQANRQLAAADVVNIVALHYNPNHVNNAVIGNATVQQIATNTLNATVDAIDIAAAMPGATLDSVADAAAVAAAVAAIASRQTGITPAHVSQIALAAARAAGGGVDAIDNAITTALAGPPVINVTAEIRAFLRQAAGSALNAQREARAPGANQQKIIKSTVMSDSVKSTALALGVTDEKAEEVRQATKDSLSNKETDLEAVSRGASLLSGGTGLAVAAVGAFVADPALTPLQKAQQVSEASGNSQVRTSQRVLSSRPGHLDPNIPGRAALEKYTADEEAARAEAMKKERAKLMKMMPGLPPLQTIKPSRTLDIEILDAKSALTTWSIKTSDGRSERLGSKFSPFKPAADALSKCVDADGKSFLTRSALEAVIKDLKKNRLFNVPGDVTIIEKPGGGITVDFSTSSNLQIYRLIAAWAARCQTDYAATRIPNPSPSPMRLGNPSE